MTLKYTEGQTNTPLSILPISPPIKPSTTGEQTIKYSVIANELYNSDMQINAHTLAHNYTHADVTHTHTHIRRHTVFFIKEAEVENCGIEKRMER